MEFACISCWTEFSVKDEDIIKSGHSLKCPTCGYSQAISVFQKREPEEEKKVEFRKPMSLSQKQKKPGKPEAESDQTQGDSERIFNEPEKIKPIPHREPFASPGGEWLVKSISGLVYHFPSIYPLQTWASMLDSSRNFLVSKDGSFWKNLEEFLNYYKQTSNIQLSFERAGSASGQGASVVPFSGTVEQSQSEIKAGQPGEPVKPEPPKPLTRQTSQFTFKIEEKKSGKYKNTLLIIIVFSAAIAGGTAILLLMLKGL